MNPLPTFRVCVVFLLFISFPNNIVSQSAGDIVITEFKPDPDCVSDANGEYFEIYNTTNSVINIDGWTVTDNGTNNHTINNSGPLDVPASGFLTLCRNGDFNTNGGVSCDYSFPFILVNSGDQIELKSGPTTITNVTYTMSFPAGTAAELANITTAKNNGGIIVQADLINATTTIPCGDKGSPGALGNTILPIELTEFRGDINGGEVELYWTTVSEVNNDYILIQRQINGNKFEDIGQVDGAGTSFIEHEYSFSDVNPHPGTNYYRLKQVDFDGSYSYSKTISIDIKKEGGTHLYPTISNDKVTLYFPESRFSQNIIVYDISGKEVLRSEIKPWAGFCELGIAHLSQGHYFVQLFSDIDTTVKRFIKQ